MIKIEFGNGKVLSDLTLNGNNFVTSQDITDEFFDGGLDNVKITTTYKPDDNSPEQEYTELHDHMKLIYCRKYPGESGTFFVLNDYSKTELKDIALDARLSYLEMMTDLN